MSHSLRTDRLILRPPKAQDVPSFAALLNDFDVAKNLTRVPHPYTETDGHAFVALCQQKWAHKEDFAFMIVARADNALMGCCGLHPDREFEFGYWVGRPYWGRGYATEAGACAIAFAFTELRAERLHAGWFFDNPASGRVLGKLGFVPDGTDERQSLSRGRAVLCNKVVLTREAWAQREDQP